MKRRIPFIVLMGLFLIITPVRAKDKIQWTFGDTVLNFSGALQTESGFNTRTFLLNKNIPYDKGFVVKTKFDMTFDVVDPLTEMKVTLRNKATWGSNKSASTSLVTLNDNGALGLSHRHDIGSRIMWVREGWIKVILTDLFAMKLPKQEFTMGSFSFTLGRGIALGDAYAVSPASLGFFQDFSVDQFAYGALVSGGIVPNMFSYDAYVALLENKSNSISETGAQTQYAEFGKKNDPFRGFGKINWILAGRLNADPIKNEKYKLHFETYALYNSAPEQTIEFTGDSKSNLGTIGMAMEFAAPAVEFGFDCAANRGQQRVKGWDRNRIQNINRQGVSTYVYSDVYTVDPSVTTVSDAYKAVYDTSNSAEVLAVNEVPRSLEFNGAEIPGTTLYNGLSRFRAPYTNRFQGYMAVMDAGLWLLPKQVMISFGGGISSGDVNPNVNLTDPSDTRSDIVYEGFIPIQEVYTGDRIRSTFVLGGGGLNRLLDTPDSGNGIASIADSFTNLIFNGCSLRIITKFWGKSVVIQPNILSYYSDFTGNKFDMATGRITTEQASNHLGVEFNMFSTVTFTDSLKSTFVWIVFLPGQQYRDIKGKPFTADQRRIINKYLGSGNPLPEDLPVLGSDIVFGASWLLGYSF